MAFNKWEFFWFITYPYLDNGCGNNKFSSDSMSLHGMESGRKVHIYLLLQSVRTPQL